MGFAIKEDFGNRWVPVVFDLPSGWTEEGTNIPYEKCSIKFKDANGDTKVEYYIKDCVFYSVCYFNFM